MNNVVDFPNQEKRLDEASLWLARIDRHLSDDEKNDLIAWLRQDIENLRVLVELANLWDKMDRLSLLSEVFHSQPKKKNYFSRYLAAAAIAFLIVCTPAIWFFLSQPDENFNNQLFLKTAIGEQRKVFLVDGSTLILNTNSQVRVIYSDNQRLLLLDTGEIHIDVAHDTSRPLRVIANDKIVQAVGTAFDVRLLDSNQVKLWVTEGRVLIADSKHPVTQKSFDKIQLPAANFSLSKGEKVVLSKNTKAVEKISDGEMKAQLGWQQGSIIFRGETLEEAVLEFSRYSDKNFILKDNALKSIRIAGNFKIGDTQSLLSTLQNNFSIHYQYGEENTILLSAK